MKLSSVMQTQKDEVSLPESTLFTAGDMCAILDTTMPNPFAVVTGGNQKVTHSHIGRAREACHAPACMCGPTGMPYSVT
jgi:hypothetical protein